MAKQKRKWLVDPTKITKYNRTEEELQLLLLFCIAVAGKNATTTAQNLERLLEFSFTRYEQLFSLQFRTPFNVVRCFDWTTLSFLMKQLGFGCYKLKSQGLLYAANSNLNLKTCTAEDLEKLPGIGMKTARFFILHSRKNAQVACLDTHILKWLADYTGYEMPRDKKGKLKTPSRKKYLELEQAFLGIAKAMKMSPADLDLRIWNKSRGTDDVARRVVLEKLLGAAA